MTFVRSHAPIHAPAVAMRPRAVHRQRRCAGLLGVLLVWVSASGAGCPQILQQYTQPVPRALPPKASLTQIVDVINQNSARVQSLSTTRATVTTPGAPTLDATIAFQRPRSFRLLGSKFGPQVDLGSNDDLLWFWIKQAQPPAMFFVRHDQFATSSARQIIPVEPEWLIEAFGVVTFDPALDQIDGPFPVGNNRVEIKSRSRVPGKGMSRITIIDDSRGIVLEEHLYDPQGTRLATAVLSKHFHDPASGATLPRHVEIQWPSAQFNLSVDMADLHVNQLPADPRQFFAKPTYSGYNEVDLAHPNNQLTPSANGQYHAPPQVRYQ
jgi:hypothetical protein